MRRKLHQNGLKHCSGCGQWQELGAFHAHKRSWDGRHPHCRACQAAGYQRRYAVQREVMLERGRLYRAANPEKRRDTRLRSRFGIPLAEWQRMEAAQGGVCLICKRPEKLHVDHCHTNGNVRSLLCRGCNTAIGALGECPERIRAAAAYVESFQLSTAPAPAA